MITIWLMMLEKCKGKVNQNFLCSSVNGTEQSLLRLNYTINEVQPFSHVSLTIQDKLKPIRHFVKYDKKRLVEKCGTWQVPPTKNTQKYCGDDAEFFWLVFIHPRFPHNTFDMYHNAIFWVGAVITYDPNEKCVVVYDVLFRLPHCTFFFMVCGVA